GTASLETELTHSEATPVIPPRPRNYRWLVWLAALCGVIGQLLFSNDWCLYTIPAALLAAFVFWVAVAFIAVMSRSGRLPRWPVGFALAVVIGLASGSVFRVLPSWAFQTALGTDRPDKIRDLHICRHYEGGGGDHTLILEFTADEATFRALPIIAVPANDYHVTKWRE